MPKRAVVNLREVEAFVPAGAAGKYASRLLVDGESVGSRNLVLNHFTLRPGQRTYSGRHPAPFEEVYYILRGRGRLTLGSGKRKKRYAVGPDTVAYIAATVDHQIENVGRRNLEMLTVMPFHPAPGVNSVYDERKQRWGSSFRLMRKSARHLKQPAR